MTSHVSCKRQAFFSLLLLCVLVVGCAGKSAFREGNELLAIGKSEEGLVKLQEAVRSEPRDAEYKATYIHAKERVIRGYLERAKQLLDAGNVIDAGILYSRVLEFDTTNGLAREGLRLIDIAKRHERVMQDARAAWNKKDTQGALAKLRGLLTEDPNHAEALALKRTIDEQSAEPSIEAALAAAFKKRITIEFKDVTIKQVFEVISRTSGLNFLFDKDIKTDQKTSIFLRNSTIEAAVNYTALTNQLEHEVLDANTVLIYPNTAAKSREYRQTAVKSFYLANADAKSVASSIKTIVKSQDIVADEKLNMVIVRDTPEAIRLIDKLVALHDVADPEVMLEVEILEVKRTRLQELGVNWPNSLSLTPLVPVGSDVLTLNDLRNNTNSRTLGVGVAPIVINARQDDSDAKVLANPRIRARNREKAKILIGERVPNITTTATATGFLSESVNYIDVGLKLEVEPTIYLDNEVAIKIALEVSNITSQLQTKTGSVAYQIGTRTASTVLRLKDGENQVLAGLINDEDRRSASKLPGLGEIPVVGRLFGSSQDDNQKTEIVLSITPRLVRNIQRPEAALAEFRAATSFRPQSPSGQRTSGNTGVSNSAPATSQRQSAASAPGEAGPNADSAGGLKGGAGSSAASTAGAGVSAVGGVAGATAGAGVSAVDGVAGATGMGGGVGVAQPSAAQMKWSGPNKVSPGSAFALQLLMQANQPVTSLPMAVGFDSRALEVVNVQEGDFLKQGGARTDFTSRVDRSGQVLITGTRSGENGATSAGVVATINFKALVPMDATNIQLVTIAPLGVAGQQIPVSLPPPFSVQIQR